MNQKQVLILQLLALLILCPNCPKANAQVAILPSREELNRSFGAPDEHLFKTPAKVYYPETWFHYVGGNVSEKGITADLEAIAKAGISGIQLFHGQFGEPWPGVEQQIACLSPLWDNAVKHTAQECRRLGLRFTMQNCPGWAMAGGPWIQPANAMRHLVWSRTDVTGSAPSLPVPQPSNEEWRDYQDITVLAFPTPSGDTNEPLKPSSAQGSRDFPWAEWISGVKGEVLRLPPTRENAPHWVEVTFPESVTLRTIELSSVQGFNHGWCYEPGVTVTLQALLPNGEREELIHSVLPQSNWQDDRPISLACPERAGVNKYRISIVNQHDMALGSLRLYTAARKNNWESEAGWTLRSIERAGANPQQSTAAFIDPTQIRDLSALMDKEGKLNWKAPAGKWTILRIGHVNAGMKNGPAPPEGTGWECDKLSKAGSDAHFAGYIGRLTDEAKGPLGKELLNGVLLDSWECKTQTWTADMESEFGRIADYKLRKWLPALFGFVIKDHDTTTRFLHDWRNTINRLFVDNFFGNLSKRTKERGLSLSFETAGGDVLPVDIMEYYKHADVPMCEFWQPFTAGYVGSLNFKPVKPAASAARMYGKPRVGAESFTSFSHTWDEQWSMLKEVGNMNIAEGVTHLIYHTYTHNPQVGFLPPGTSFSGAGIGTPFLRGQTWWKHMPAFNAYFARCGFLLERGRPVSDVLWYLGDEIDHKPDQNAPFPQGYKYDYCNPDALMNRLSVKNGEVVTPEGIAYRVIWLPENERMLPQTVEKLYTLIREGATVIGNPPKRLATLSGGANAQKRLDAAVKSIWGTAAAGIRKIGKGCIVSGKTLSEALNELQIMPDVTTDRIVWTHRKADRADWYFVCAPQGGAFSGTVDFRSKGQAELWDPETGEVTPLPSERKGAYTSVPLELAKAGSCFVVFRTSEGATGEAPKQRKIVETIALDKVWTLTFPSGWGAPATFQTTELKAWKDLDLPAEAKAFSGTVSYTTTFNVAELNPEANYQLHLGRIEMIGVVTLNGKELRTVWAPPYRADLTKAIQPGENKLTVEVTSSWYNRLIYDARQPEAKRKTWAIRRPAADAPLRDSGLLGPVSVTVETF